MSYDGTSTLDHILRRAKLRIAVEFNDPPDSGFPPEMYIDPDTGKPWGIGPILGGIVAQDLGVELECVDIPWPQQVEALLDGRVDLLPKHTLIPRRALDIEFIDGRMAQLRITCTVPAERDLTDLEQLNHEDVVITHWHGSSIGELVRERFPKASVLESPTPFVELKEGRAHACVNDSITHRFLELNPELKLVRDADGRLVVLSREYNKFAIRPGDHRFLNWLNSWYDYRHALGTIQYWCDEWWESYMADRDD